ncbi:SCO family protein [Roseitranquillus sediminis]|uniref:SCO family protein n=1 Tax=Roseitranquillus sediminis TaxID=2809051 RepID=UPI001D0C5491|nr:SCO family protein [Roseitranquillus sediminis]MBM9595118.1 SCO family protein [Roseitranquillus sediminis]
MATILWLAVAVAGLAVAALFFWQSRPETTASAPQEPALQADFELTDHRGRTRTDEEFRGDWLLVFFGFTNCPDVCPMGLANIAQAMDELGGAADEVQPLFISVDPKRDTPESLAEYVFQFHPSIIGLTGTPEQVDETAETFAIYKERVEDPSAPDGYTMGHTSSILLFDPDGGLVRIFEYSATPEDIARDLRERVRT